MLFNLAFFALGGALSWTNPVLSAGFFLAWALLGILGLKILGSVAEAAMKQSPLYAARFWTDSERDALERYALYWRQPRLGRRLSWVLAALSWSTAGLAAGPALLHGDWVLPAFALVAGAMLLRSAQQLDPLAFFSKRAAAKDFSGSELQGAVLAIKEHLEQNGWR